MKEVTLQQFMSSQLRWEFQMLPVWFTRQRIGDQYRTAGTVQYIGNPEILSGKEWVKV